MGEERAFRQEQNTCAQTSDQNWMVGFVLQSKMYGDSFKLQLLKCIVQVIVFCVFLAIMEAVYLPLKAFPVGGKSNYYPVWKEVRGVNAAISATQFP